MKILAFAASNNLESINKKLATYACELFRDTQQNCEIEVLDLNDFEMPIYRPDREQINGIPQQAQDFYKKIGEADKLIISFAEYNGSYTAAFKNIFDWTSRIDQKLFQEKKTLVMATSPGRRGGIGVLKTIENAAPHFGMIISGVFSLPSFQENFDLEKNEIKNGSLRDQLIEQVSQL
ncbi:MAG: NAD(P)H-dependent oxidoreductase [Pseudomonadota bacterium]